MNVALFLVMGLGYEVWVLLLFAVGCSNWRQLLLYSQAKEVLEADRVESLSFSLYKSLKGEMKAWGKRQISLIISIINKTPTKTLFFSF